jgi:hypothetical protein
MLKIALIVHWSPIAHHWYQNNLHFFSAVHNEFTGQEDARYSDPNVEAIL